MDDALPPLLFRYKKYIDELLFATFSIINESDPNRTAKQLHLKYWCRAFGFLFIQEDGEQNPFLRERIPFFLDVLSDEECWEETDTIHRVNLNRRIAAKKIVQSSSRSGIPNPLDYHQRYRVACWCCLEEDIFALFDYFKQNSGIRTDDAAELNKLVGKELSRSCRSEPLTVYWSHIAGGYASEMHLEGKHLLEYGLEFVFVAYVPYVEAVEFFFNKIRSLSENEVSDKQKNEIIIRTAVRAAESNAGEYPEVFEYCNRQLSGGLLESLVKKNYMELVWALLDKTCIYETKMLMNSSKVNDIISELHQRGDKYSLKKFLSYVTKESENPSLLGVGVNSELENEVVSAFRQGKYLDSLEKSTLCNQDSTRLVENQSNSSVEEDGNSKTENYVPSEILQRQDQYSLNDVSSCNYAIRDSENQGISAMEVDADWSTPLPKRQRIE